MRKSGLLSFLLVISIYTLCARVTKIERNLILYKKIPVQYPLFLRSDGIYFYGATFTFGSKNFHLYKFDQQWNIITSKVIAQGKGPGEMDNIIDFTVSEGRICFFEALSYRVHFFNSKFNYSDTVSLDIRGGVASGYNKFIVYKGGIYFINIPHKTGQEIIEYSLITGKKTTEYGDRITLNAKNIPELYEKTSGKQLSGKSEYLYLFDQNSGITSIVLRGILQKKVDVRSDLKKLGYNMRTTQMPDFNNPSNTKKTSLKNGEIESVRIVVDHFTDLWGILFEDTHKKEHVVLFWNDEGKLVHYYVIRGVAALFPTFNYVEWMGNNYFIARDKQHLCVFMLTP